MRFWRSAGIGHVGLSFRKLEEAGVSGAARRVRQAGLSVSTIGEVGWWLLDDRSTWHPQQERLLRAVDAAQTMGAPCIVLTSGPAGSLTWEDAIKALGEAVAPVVAHAEARDVALALENTSAMRLDLSFVTSLRDTIEVARATELAVCLEVNSCFAEGALEATITSAIDLIAHVQLNDFVIGSLCTPDRAVPGDGDIPLERIVRALESAGYDCSYELELVGPRIETEGYTSAIRRSVTYLDALLERVGAS
jgi:sugar phosphate isomerase/epimerase